MVTWGWLGKGCLDGLKYITLDFSKRRNTGGLGKNAKIAREVYRFLAGVDMARKHGMGMERVRRCVGLREFTIRGIQVDEDSKDSFRFWFGENVSFVEGMKPLRGVRKRQIPCVTCKFQTL